jgi:hypothetical protein
MLRRIAVVGMAVALLAGVGAPAQASFFSSVLVGNSDNTFEDQSRGAFVDVNKNNVIDTGDVVVGFIRLDNRTQPAPGLALNNQMYAIFSEQVTAVVPVGPSTGYILGPTTVAGLKMTDLVAGTTANDMFAVFSKNTPFSTDLIIASPGNRVGSPAVTLADYLDLIKSEGTFDIAGGIVPGLPLDFFEEVVTCGAGGAACPTSLALAPFSTSTGSFVGGLTIDANTTGVVFQPVVACGLGGVTGAASFDYLCIARGALGGVIGAVNQPEWTNIADVGAGPFQQCLVNGVNTPCGVTDKGDFTVHPFQEVPEPGSLVLLGLGLLGAAGLRRFRRI